jgi:hypothetical protein
VFAQTLGSLFYTLSTPPSGADKIRVYLWQVITAIHDEVDGLILCEQLSQDYDCTHCVTFEVPLWRFLYNLINMHLWMGSEIPSSSGAVSYFI